MNQGPNQYPSVPPGGYGIEQALALLKSIPTEGVDEKVVVDIVRKTLESAGISIPALLEIANRRQDEITNEIVRIQGEIATLHQQIEERTGQVSFFQEQLAEIGSLRERFEV